MMEWLMQSEYLRRGELIVIIVNSIILGYYIGQIRGHKKTAWQKWKDKQKEVLGI